jgi:prolipoprotein diacylglyceryltransferase
MVILGVLVFVFWISMLIDCLKRKFKEDSEKIVWVIVIVFTGIIGALIYYFIVKTKDKKRVCCPHTFVVSQNNLEKSK